MAKTNAQRQKEFRFRQKIQGGSFDRSEAKGPILARFDGWITAEAKRGLAVIAELDGTTASKVLDSIIMSAIAAKKAMVERAVWSEVAWRVIDRAAERRSKKRDLTK